MAQRVDISKYLPGWTEDAEPVAVAPRVDIGKYIPGWTGDAPAASVPDPVNVIRPEWRNVPISETGVTAPPPSPVAPIAPRPGRPLLGRTLPGDERLATLEEFRDEAGKRPPATIEQKYPDADTQAQRSIPGELLASAGSGLANIYRNLLTVPEIVTGRPLAQDGRFSPDYWRRVAETPQLRRVGKLATDRPLSDELRDPRWWTRGVGEMLPQTGVSLGVAAGTGGVGAFGFIAALEGGNAYDDAIAQGADRKAATVEALAVGAVNGVLEMLPLNDLLKRVGKPGVDAAKRTAIRQIANVLKQAAIQGTEEGVTEGMQEAWSMFVGKLGHNYSPTESEVVRRVTSSVLLGGATGGLFGVGGGLAQSVSSAMQEDTATQPKVAMPSPGSGKSIDLRTGVELGVPTHKQRIAELEEQIDAARRASRSPYASEQEEMMAAVAPKIAPTAQEPSFLQPDTPIRTQALGVPEAQPTDAELARGAIRQPVPSEQRVQQPDIELGVPTQQEVDGAVQEPAAQVDAPEQAAQETEVAEAGQAQEVAKEPWQMTRDDVVWGIGYAAEGANTDRALRGRLSRWKKIQQAAAAEGESIPSVDEAIAKEKARIARADAHRAAVEAAAKQGKIGDGIKDYPDLAAKYVQPAQPEAENAQAVAPEQRYYAAVEAERSAERRADETFAAYKSVKSKHDKQMIRLVGPNPLDSDLEAASAAHDEAMANLVSARADAWRAFNAWPRLAVSESEKASEEPTPASPKPTLLERKRESRKLRSPADQELVSDLTSSPIYINPASKEAAWVREHLVGAPPILRRWVSLSRGVPWDSRMTELVGAKHIADGTSLEDLVLRLKALAREKKSAPKEWEAEQDAQLDAAREEWLAREYNRTMDDGIGELVNMDSESDKAVFKAAGLSEGEIYAIAESNPDLTWADAEELLRSQLAEEPAWTDLQAGTVPEGAVVTRQEKAEIAPEPAQEPAPSTKAPEAAPESLPASATPDLSAIPAKGIEGAGATVGPVGQSTMFGVRERPTVPNVKMNSAAAQAEFERLQAVAKNPKTPDAEYVSAIAKLSEMSKTGELPGQGTLIEQGPAKLNKAERPAKRTRAPEPAQPGQAEIFPEKQLFGEPEAKPAPTVRESRSVGQEQDPAKYPGKQYRPADQTQTPEFKRWFGNSKVVDENGKPLVMYHGTTHGFSVFDTGRANIENHFGRGLYFTDSPDDVSRNYAGFGPDLTSRIEHRADLIMQDEEYDAYTYGGKKYMQAKARAIAKAKKELAGSHGGAVMPVFLHIQNPADLRQNGTRLTYEEEYDYEQYVDDAKDQLAADGNDDPTQDEVKERAIEIARDTDAPIGESGTAVDFIDALRTVAARYDETVGDPAESVIGMLYDEPLLSDVIDNLRRSDAIQYATDESGALASSELLRAALEEAGYDGIIMDADKEFGFGRKFGKSMEGVAGATHAIAFNSTQVKSATGNIGTFDPTNPDIRYRGEGASATDRATAAQRAALVKLNQKIFGDRKVDFDRVFNELGKEQAGQFENDLITINEGVADPTETFWHEAVHKAERLFLTDAERQSLEAMQPDAEKRAEDILRFAKWRDWAKTQATWTTKARTIVIRLLDTIKRLVGPDQGFRRISDFYAELTAGDYRGQATATKREAQPAFKEQPEPAPLWYSKMRQVMESKLPGRQPAKMLLNTIDAWQRKGEFKAEELSDSGLKEWLARQDGPVTKQDVLDFLDENAVQVKEVELGTLSQEAALNAFFDRMRAKYGQGRNGGWDNDKLTAAEREEYNGLMDAFERARPLRESKYSQYTVPGGENYKELLITLPNVRLDKAGEALRAFEAQFKSRPIPADQKAEHERLRQAVADAKQSDASQFTGSHWDEPNVVAHVRMNERTDADGKRVLFIEEIQSDWHQKGRKEGYINDVTKEKAEKSGYSVYRAKSNLGTEAFFLRGPDSDKGLTNIGFSTEAGAWSGLISYLKTNMKSVPDAPFKKSWPALAMKRMVRYAAENGFDRIAWTTGEQQAERYDLSKQIDSLKSYENADGTYAIQAIKDDVIVLAESELDATGLEATVGKELARKIVAGEGVNIETAVSKQLGRKDREFSGLDLKVGGEGMKSFYDRELVSIAKDIGKKYGAQVGDTTIRTQGNRATGEWEVLDENGDYLQSYPTRETAQRAMELDGVRGTIRAGSERAPVADHVVHSLDITPELRREALTRGMPLYRPDPNAEADNLTASERFARAYIAELNMTPDEAKQFLSTHPIAWWDEFVDRIRKNGRTLRGQQRLFRAIKDSGKADSGKLTEAEQLARDYIAKLDMTPEEASAFMKKYMANTAKELTKQGKTQERESARKVYTQEYAKPAPKTPRGMLHGAERVGVKSGKVEMSEKFAEAFKAVTDETEAPKTIYGTLRKTEAIGALKERKKGFVRAAEDAIDITFRQMAEEHRSNPTKWRGLLDTVNTDLETLDLNLANAKDDQHREWIAKTALRVMFGDRRYLAIRRASRGDVFKTVDYLKRTIGEQMTKVYSALAANEIARVNPDKLYNDPATDLNLADQWRELMSQYGVAQKKSKAIRDAKGYLAKLKKMSASPADIKNRTAGVEKMIADLTSEMAQVPWKSSRELYEKLAEIRAADKSVKQQVHDDRVASLERRIDEVVKTIAEGNDDILSAITESGVAPRRRGLFKSTFVDSRGDMESWANTLAGGREESAVHDVLVKRLRSGHEESIRPVMEGNKEFWRVAKQLGFSEKDIELMDAQRKPHEIDGFTHRLTDFQIMNLYLHTLNDGARMKVMLNGPKSDAKRGLITLGRDVIGATGGEDGIPNAVEKLIGTLSDKQKNLALAMMAIKNAYTQQGNATALRVKGMELFLEPNHWGLKVDVGDTEKLSATDLSDPKKARATLMQHLFGMTKARVPHSHTVLMPSAYGEFVRQLEDIGRFIHMTEPALDALAVLNSPRVRQAMIERYGTGFGQRIRDVISEATGMTAQQSGWGWIRATAGYAQRRISGAKLGYRFTSIANNAVGGSILLTNELSKVSNKLAADFAVERGKGVFFTAGSENARLRDVLLDNPFFYDRFNMHLLRTMANLPTDLNDRQTLRAVRKRKRMEIALRGMAHEELCNAVAAVKAYKKNGYSESDAVRAVNLATRRSQNPSTPFEATGWYSGIQRSGLGVVIPFFGQVSVAANILLRDAQVFARAMATGKAKTQASNRLVKTMGALTANAAFTSGLRYAVARIAAGALYGLIPDDQKKRLDEYAAMGLMGELMDVIVPGSGRLATVSVQAVKNVIKSKKPAQAVNALGSALAQSERELTETLPGSTLRSGGLAVKDIATGISDDEWWKIERGLLRAVEFLGEVAGEPVGGPVQAAKIVAGLAGRPIGKESQQKATPMSLDW